METVGLAVIQRNAYSYAHESTFLRMVASLEATAFADEATKFPAPTATLVATAFADEATTLPGPMPTLIATAFADENTRLADPVPTLIATAFADENSIIPDNPSRLFTYDVETGTYVRAPWYTWNGTSWVQAI
jgi:hypothetical protein